MSSDDSLLRAIAHAPARVPQQRPLEPGARVGAFRILAELGAGGMGVVYRAEDERLGREVALKVIAASAEHDEASRRRFLREARAAAAVSHPNVATVFEVSEDGGRIYIAMELASGATLRARLASGPLDVTEALSIACQIARGLARAHENGVVHRDLKPDNVMVGELVKVLDFGIARWERDQVADERASVVAGESRAAGTLGYMAPEQTFGADADARSDVFALGVVLYEMLAGERPFPGSSATAVALDIQLRRPVPLSARRPDVPPELDRVVERCLAYRPPLRYANAKEVLAALDELPTAAEPAARASRRTSAPPKPSGPRETRGLVGREHELTLLHQLFEESQDHSGRIALLAGEPGVGKTRLLDAFLAEVADAGATVLRGVAFDGDGEPPYAPWSRALGSHSLHLARPTGEASFELAEERLRVGEVAFAAFAALSAERPVVVGLDDLHWAGADALWLFRHLARCMSHEPVLFVATCRNTPEDGRSIAELIPLLRREARVVEMTVCGLSLEATAAYLAQLGTPPPTGLVRTLHAETNGNPLFLGEMFRHLVEERRLLSPTGSWQPELPGEGVRVPETIRQLLAERLARLRPETLAALRIGSLFADGFDLRALAFVEGLSEDLVLDRLEEAVEAGILRAPQEAGGSYRMSHEVVRRAIQDGVGADRRAQLHRRVAVALAAQPGAEPGEVAAQYFASAALGGAEAGAPFALMAAARAEAQAADALAARQLRIAHALSPPGKERAAIACRLALAEASALHLEDAEDMALRASTELHDAVAPARDIADFLGRASQRLQEHGAMRNAWEPLARRAVALCGDERDLTWARLQLLNERFEPVETGVVHVSRWLGTDPEALAILRREGNEEDRVRTLQPYAYRTPAETTAVFAALDALSTPRAVVHGLDVVARDLLYRQGRLREAIPVLERLVREGERRGSFTARVEGLAQLSLCRLQLGEFVAAGADLAAARELVGRLGREHRLHLVVEVAAATLHGYIRGHHEFASIAEAAVRASGDALLGRGPLGPTIGGLAALATALVGDRDTALRIARVLGSGLERIEPTAYIANGAAFNGSAALWELGAAEHAPVFRRVALRMIEAGVTGGPCCSLELVVARMAALCGDVEDALAWMDRARDHLEQAGYLPLLAIAAYDEARIAAAHYRPRSRRALLRARQAFQDLGMDGWARRAASAPTRGRRPRS